MRPEGLSPLIPALDVRSLEREKKLVEKLSDYADVFKIGPALFIRYGQESLNVVREKKKKIFLDLKLFDIPNTVRLASENLKELGVFMLTVHALGGRDMIRAAKEASGALVLAVTILTSLSERDLKDLGFSLSLEDQIIKLAETALEAGADGIICSPREVRLLREKLGPDFIIVTPGIRPEAASDDQKRAETPEVAIRNGADFLVIGRPLYEAADPAEKAAKILSRIAQAGRV